MRKTTSQFIADARRVHGDKYDYSLVRYINRDTKVKIICPVHGVFEQKPSDHISKSAGCPKCKFNKLSLLYKKSSDYFVSEAKKIFPDYDYSKVQYKNNKQKVRIICPVHGEFEKSPSHILSGQGCSFCSMYKRNAEAFIADAKKIHGDKYDYSKVNYKNGSLKVSIRCNNCGRYFLQSPRHHLEGKGCPYCNFSKGEKMIGDLLKENGIEFEEQKTFDDCVYKKKLRFDFFIPICNTVIEYQGMQHYKAVEYFGGNSSFDESLRRDQIKRDFCHDKMMREIEIRYDDDIDKIIKSIMLEYKEKKNGKEKR